MTTPTASSPSLADDLAEMMAAWNKIEQAAKEQFPGLGDDVIYEITKGAMNQALGLDTDQKP